ncbi:hypothetical protein [Streptomyces sp. NBC_00236]|uniref:hypothetical protein n=1 Tax=Streptomyces sp. NBC_00236 TaxID=2903639 RepID=UPI002E29D8CD|nr:hypothetical protein [Streptomyces sp. NBC_00236]
MRTTEENVCARDGCGWTTEHVWVADMALPTSYCSDACADFDWLRRCLDALELTADVIALYGNLRGVADVLDARTDPTQIGALIDD